MAAGSGVGACAGPGAGPGADAGSRLAAGSAASADAGTCTSDLAGYVLGIDVGASSVKVVALTAGAGADPAPGETPLLCLRLVHQGDAEGAVRTLLSRAREALAPATCVGVAATGSGAPALAARAAEAGPGLAVLDDVPALALGAGLLVPSARSLVQMGAQGSCFVGGLGTGAPPTFSMSEGCASGTGAFFEDQMSRLGLAIENYSALVARAGSVPRLSGRCAVFAKTDIIHRQQEGVPVEDILLGLCYATVRSYKALIVRGAEVARPVALAGGVVLNAGVVRAVREVLGLGEGELLADEGNLYLQAAGAALHARGLAAGAPRAGLGAGTAREADAGASANQGAAARTLGAARASQAAPSCTRRPDPSAALAAALGAPRPAADLPRLAPLPDEGYVPGPGFAAIPRAEWPRDGARPGLTRATLGIDAGSTSTNLVLLSMDGRVLDAQYLRTRGDARAAVREGLASLAARLGDAVEVVAVATTGSGRTLCGRLVGADAVVDEITCQAAGATHVDPQADTVFEIGGQDSKFVSLAAGGVADFQMNKVCAAGTGSFIEEQAARLGIALDGYGALALGAAAPVDLGERCTVFMESAITSALAAGAGKADVAAGLAASIVRNYLNRVVATGRVGDHIVLQGGVAYNPAIVAAFRAAFGERLSVSPDFAVSGAVGAALMAARAAAAPDFAGTAFKGFDLAGAGRAPRAAEPSATHANRAFFRRTKELFLAGYSGARDPAKRTVGVPRCLMLHRLFPLANGFFSQLGFNVLLTDDTTPDAVARSQELAQGETCYPVKLIYGHMAQLVEAGVDYVFMPRLHTIRHAGSHVAHNYACPYMQCAPELVARALDLEGHGIRLLSPILDMDFGEQSMATAMLDVGAELGFSPEETARAVLAGGFAVRRFGDEAEALGVELLASCAPGERVLVLVTRNYGTSDGALNMGIPDLLLDRGQRVITLSHLHGGHEEDLSAEHPGVCWPFGQHILSGARIIRRDPRLFAVYLTNHGCGPDTMLDHLFAEEMGPKPYLRIEVDEHASDVGVATRVEAFLNALSRLSWEDACRLSAVGAAAGGAVGGPVARRAAPEPAASEPAPVSPVAAAPVARSAASAPAPGPATVERGASPRAVPDQGERLDPARPVALPGVGAHSEHVAAWLRGRGLADVRVVPLDARALEAGRPMSLTKEYCSFTAMAGAALLAARDCPEVQLLLPGSRGAEADSQYDRVIRAGLRARGLGGVALRAPRLETLPWELGEEAAGGLFDALLAADVELARAAGARPGPALSLVGEWPVVLADGLTGGTWGDLDARGYQLLRMPLSEYLWFLWADALDEDRASAGGPGQGGGAPAHAGRVLSPALDCPDAAELERRAAALAGLRTRMGAASDALGEASPFADDLGELRRVATARAGRLMGANARYRAAKVALERRRRAGVIVCASHYENVDTILGLMGDADPEPGAAPALRLAFDGTLDPAPAERLRSWLYYVR